MTYCTRNRILKIDLTTGQILSEPIDRLVDGFLGGRGLNQRLLFDEFRPGIHALSPGSILAIGAGLLVGTGAPFASRLSIDSKSVFSEGIGSANMGGHFATELKRAGFDHILLSGKSDHPVYAWIHDGEVQLKDASAIWVKSTVETEHYIRKELAANDAHIISIGQAGAKLTRIACIIGDRGRAAGRCGLGAIMGSKNIKAIAVKGTGKISVACPEQFISLVQDYSRKLVSAQGSRMRGIYGTIPAVKALNSRSVTPYRNFQDEYLPEEKVAKFSPEAFEKYSESQLACASCPIGCHHVYRVNEGPYEGLVCNKLEANSVWDFGTKLDIEYPPAVMKAQQLCTEYGLDIDGASSVIGWAMDCYEHGIITKADTGGLELRWGDHETVMILLRMIANREGFGEVLGEGVKLASERIGKGSDHFAFHIKGQDLIEPIRSLKAWALGISVSPRGAAHTRGAAASIVCKATPERALSMWGIGPDMKADSYEAAPFIVKYFEEFHALLDSLGLCFFAGSWLDLDGLFPEDLALITSSALGQDLSVEDLMLIGERIHNVEKAFNVRHAGFSRKDDYPPERLMKEPIKSGPGKGELLDREKWDAMLERYYGIHGWDTKTGWPQKETLVRLGLEDVAGILEQERTLAS